MRDRRAGARRLVLAATDPANPYGAALPWPQRDATTAAARRAPPGAYVVLVDGEPVLYVERGGKGLHVAARGRTTRAGCGPRLEALAEAVRRGRVRASRSSASTASPSSGRRQELLIELGFRPGPRRLTLSA